MRRSAATRLSGCGSLAGLGGAHLAMVVVGLAAALAVLLPADSAHGAEGSWERAWGKDVVAGGGAGFQVCTVAASCKAGAIGGLGGELNNPGGVATDAAGNVYVADFSNHRIQKFDAAGSWQRAWGKNVDVGGGVGFEICTVAASCNGGATGVLGGELSSPGGVATDAAGNVYVVELVNRRIQKFDAAGTWQRAWGKDVVAGGPDGFEVCTVAANCKAGATGGLGGELNSPTGVATDVAGNVYVAERGNHRIQMFDAAGIWQRAWGKDVDDFNLSSGFEVCTVAANCKAGTSGVLGGELSSPYNVATDAAGNVYVTDLGNHRIQKFDSAGFWQRAWGKDVVVGGDVGFEICTAAANCKAGSNVTAAGGELNLPAGVATDAAGNVYVADFANDRIQRFDAAGSWQRAWGKDVVTGGPDGFEVCTVAASCKAGTSDELGGELNGPDGVATDAAGNVYVADAGNQRIQKFADPPPPPGTPAQANGSIPPDATAADFSRYRLSPRVFVAASRGRSIARRRPTGTRVSYTLSEPATVTFTVQRAARGRREGGRCRRPTRLNRRRPRCERYVAVRGSFDHQGGAGANRFKFTGRLRGRKLRPGRYRLRARAVDAAGNASPIASKTFRIVRR